VCIQGHRYRTQCQIANEHRLASPEVVGSWFETESALATTCETALIEYCLLWLLTFMLSCMLIIDPWAIPMVLLRGLLGEPISSIAQNVPIHLGLAPLGPCEHPNPGHQSTDPYSSHQT